MPGNKQHRVRAIELRVADSTGDRIPCVVSTEEPVDRGDYFEVLSHSPRDIDLRRAPLPLIVQHDHSQLNVGVVEELQVVDRKLRGVARFGSGELAQQLLSDVKDGIVRNLSVGYRIIKALEELGSVVRFAWQPLEVSAVSIPADTQAGFFRTLTLEGNHMTAMNTENTLGLDHQSRSQRRNAARSESEMRDAVTQINAMAEQFDVPPHKVRSYIEECGFDVDGFRRLVIESTRRTGADLRVDESPELGLSKREAEKYSFVNAIRAQVDPLFKRDCGFEIEVSRAFAQKTGREARGLWVPPEVLLQQRDLVVGTPAYGGNLRPTEYDAAHFIEILRKRCHVMNLGATVITGLRGNLAIPSQTGSAQAYWVTENGAVTESQPIFGQVNMAPKTCGGFTDYSRKMVLQSAPEIEMIVRKDLAGIIAVELDRVAVAGSGTGAEPLGVLGTSGIGSVAIGTNGGAPGWDHMLALEEALAIANADTTTIAYMTNQKVRRKLKGTTKVSGDAGAGFIWEGIGADDPGWGRVNGYRSVASGNVPSNLTKGTSAGVCSAIILGNWSDLIIGQWGGLDILVDPYTGATAGTHRVVALQDVDIAVRRVASFVAIMDALTS